MVLSYELACLISQKTESLSYLHIVTYKKLKGVWKDKLYPIIWYHDPKAYLVPYSKEISLDESFTFDACDDSELIKEYYDNRDFDRQEKIIRDNRMFTEPYYALNKISQDRGLTEKIEYLQRLIKESTHDRTRYINTNIMQVHCVAVCFKKEGSETKILVAKRADTREKFGGHWEFGCAKAAINKSVAQKVKEDYKQDFNIDIEPVLDQSREMQEPIPIALYHVDRADTSSGMEESDKGIIILAKIVSDFDISDFKRTKKHESVKWVVEKELSDVKTAFENCVPDFEQTLREAFDKIKSLGKE